MAKVGSLKICANCSGELPQEDVSECPHCGAKQPKKTAWTQESFTRVRPLNLQASLALKHIEKMEGGYAQKENARKDLQNELIQALKEYSALEKISLLMDTLHVVENIRFTAQTPEEVQAILTKAKHIGELAVNIEAFIKLTKKPIQD